MDDLRAHLGAHQRQPLPRGLNPKISQAFAESVHPVTQPLNPQARTPDLNKA